MADGALWVAWIPVGKGQIVDENAVVGTEWVCTKKAEQWLNEVALVHLAPIARHNICDARLEGEPDVVLTVNRDF
jgi:hypothetical protein